MLSTDSLSTESVISGSLGQVEDGIYRRIRISLHFLPLLQLYILVNLKNNGC